MLQSLHRKFRRNGIVRHLFISPCRLEQDDLITMWVGGHFCRFDRDQEQAIGSRLEGRRPILRNLRAELDLVDKSEEAGEGTGERRRYHCLKRQRGGR